MPPSELSAHQTDGGVQLMWTAHTNPNYTVQRVLRRVAGERPLRWTILPVALSATSYLDRTTMGGTTYIYRVQALKAYNKGGMSNLAEIAIP